MIDHITSPLILVDINGRKYAASPTGEKRYQTLLFLVEDRNRPGEHFCSPLDPQVLIRSCLQQNCPSWLATEDGLVHLVPFKHPVDQAAGLLEWLPEYSLNPAADLEMRFAWKKLLLLREAGQAVNSSLILEDIFEALGEVLRRYIPYEEAVIVILESGREKIHIVVRISAQGDLKISGEPPEFCGIEDPIIHTILQASYSHLYAGVLPKSFLVSEGATAAMSVPLVNKGVVIGLMLMTTRSEAGFYHYQKELFTEVSAQVAVAVENALLYWQTQAQAGRELLMNQLTRSIRQSLDMEMILGTAVMELGKVTGVSRCFISYFASEKTEMEMTEKIFQYHLPGVPSMSRWMNKETLFQLFDDDSKSKPILIHDVRGISGRQFEHIQVSDDIKSIAIFPILIRSELVGAITLHQCDGYRTWMMEDIELLNAISEHLGVALHQAQLFSTLERQKTDLENTLEELQQAQVYLIQSEKMAVLGQFVAGIAHEVNTPLGTMSSNTATLKGCLERLKAFMPSESKPIFESMEQLLDINKLASGRIQDIVKNLRNFARLDESALKIADIHEGIDSTLMLIQSSINPRIQLIRAYGDNIPKIFCYPGLLNQIFMNLLVNAIYSVDLTFEEESEFSRKTSPMVRIETSYQSESEQVTILIQDNGKGIAPEHLTKVFDPGFTTKGMGIGTGLGLALCYRIIEKHHGRICVESKVNEGASFYVILPLHP